VAVTSHPGLTRTSASSGARAAELRASRRAAQPRPLLAITVYPSVRSRTDHVCVSRPWIPRPMPSFSKLGVELNQFLPRLLELTRACSRKRLP
jgi:hypothetical protein